jgi:outer membrane protein assembly factor BamB
MSQIDLAAMPPGSAEQCRSAPAQAPRNWPPIVLLGLFWSVYAVWRWTDVGLSLGFMGFLMMAAFAALVLLLFLAWWLAGSRVGWTERLAVLGTAVLAGIAASLSAHKLLGPFLVLPGLPLVLTAWTLGFLIARSWEPRRRSLAIMGVLCVSWGAFTLARGTGMWGDGQITLRWRWSPTPEELYLAEGAPVGGAAPAVAHRRTITLQPGDWLGFRGPNRDADVRGVWVATDWNTVPPQLVWKRRIGPAWSSVVVIGARLFTQEQRGEHEAVVCLDAVNGQTLWAHRDEVRHEDVQGGAGPRATPTFANGAIFALGATGILNCLDAETGQRRWSRNIADDAGVKHPMWGFSSSPLTVGGLVVVFAGGAPEKTLLAYYADSGTPAWSAAAGQISYSSPQLASIGGETQLLFVSDGGIFAFEPSSGTPLWHHPTPPGNPGVPRAVQPRAVGPSGVLFDAGPDMGTVLIDVSRKGESWGATERWVSRQLKPSFNDFVVCEKAIYGFDGRMLTCVDLETGRRRWKEGRYGSGQVLLLGDQAVLVVITDEGEVVLVAADANEHHELGRLQAVNGKTWNHPAIARRRLYVRNAEEIACYELPLAGPRSSSYEPRSE